MGDACVCVYVCVLKVLGPINLPYSLLCRSQLCEAGHHSMHGCGEYWLIAGWQRLGGEGEGEGKRRG